MVHGPEFLRALYALCVKFFAQFRSAAMIEGKETGAPGLFVAAGDDRETKRFAEIRSLGNSD
jgi:hypothetical protein